MAIKYTIDNDEIRAWMEERNGRPVLLKGVDEDGEESPDMLHISFDPKDTNMQEMEWEEFFERFDNENLALVYDDAEPNDVPLPDFELTDRDRAREEYASDTELPDSGDEEMLREDTTLDIDYM